MLHVSRRVIWVSSHFRVISSEAVNHQHDGGIWGTYLTAAGGQ
jgi:hypothetical protein